MSKQWAVNLSQEFEQLETDVDSNTNNIDNLDKSLVDITSQLEDISTKLPEEGQLSKLTEKVDSLSFGFSHNIQEIQSIKNHVEALAIEVTELKRTQINVKESSYNVKNYGAVGDGITDDTEAIQRAFDTEDEHRMEIKFPGGAYRITQPILIRRRIGRKVVGKGLIDPQGINNQWIPPAAYLLYDGPPDLPVVELLGFGMDWSGLGIHGGNKASVGLLINKRSKGLGDGKHTFPNLSVSNCHTAVQIGAELSTHNCDNNHFEYLQVNECVLGYRVVNNMGMDHTFGHYRPYKTDTAFRFDAGGNIKMFSALITGGVNTFLSLGDPGPGGSNGDFKFMHIKQDMQNSHCKWLSCDKPGYYASIVFDGCHLSAKDYDLDALPSFEVKGATSLTFRNCWGIPTNSVAMIRKKRGGGKSDLHPYVKLDGCRFYRSNGVVHESSTGGYLVYRDCMNSSAEPLADSVVDFR